MQEVTPDAPEATVIAVHRAGITVRVDTSFGCRRCAAGRGCGAALLAAGRSGAELNLTLPAGSRVDVGDRVRLSLPPDRLLHAAWLAYGLPLGVMLGAALAAAFLLTPPVGDGMLLFTAIGGLLLGAWWARRRLGRGVCEQRFLPVARVVTSRASANRAGRVTIG
jgi:positive regulator of sigma E activity